MELYLRRAAEKAAVTYSVVHARAAVVKNLTILKATEIWGSIPAWLIVNQEFLMK